MIPAEVPMPVKKAGKFVEIPRELLEAVNAMCERFGTTFTFELVDALRRHVAYPPERKPEPLPAESVTPPDPPAKKSAAKPRKRKAT
jgi:hypothetical protein